MEEKSLYQKYKKGKHWEKHPTIYAKKFIKFLKKNNFKDLIIDAGCGSGRDVNVFKKLGFNIVGVDISQVYIKNAKKNYPNCRFSIENIENLKLPDESVGAFFMINVIHYVKKRKALKEIYRTLNKKGYLFIHFNIKIVDEKGNVDYKHNESDILRLVSNFNIIKKRIFKRIDNIPKKHTHKIIELILQK